MHINHVKEQDGGDAAPGGGTTGLSTDLIERYSAGGVVIDSDAVLQQTISDY